MMNINKDVNLGIASIRTRVVGAGVNADSGRELAFAATDPLSELVYSSHKGLSLKFANSRAADEKPFLLWNVNKAWGTPSDDMFVDKAVLLRPLENAAHTSDSHGRESIGKMANQEDLNLQIAADLQPQKVADDGATSAAGALNNNETNMPVSILAPPPFESVETKSRICLYKEKGKESALSDEYNIHGSARSCDSAGLMSRGIKRRGYVEDVMHETKRIKNQIPLFCGSTSILPPDNSFMSLISNMVSGFAESNRQDSSSFPLPLACSIDVNAPDIHQNFIDAQDSASLNMRFQTVFQSLSCKEMNLLNAGEEKENDSLEESIQLMVDEKKKLDDLCLSEQMNYAAEKPNSSGSLWVTRLCTKRLRSEKCNEIVQESIGCSTSCPKLNLDSGMNVLCPIDQKNWESRDDSDQVNQKCSTNTEVSVDLKSTCKVCSIQKFGSSDALASVFARRLGAFRHIAPLENNVKNEYHKSPLYDIVPPQNAFALSEIFRAIQNLRLSRAHILRWMNSDVSLSRLNGFFLRLRLRKLDRGQEGTSYYVACISAGDDGREVSGCTSNKSILVDVGGIKSCITCQYVSNHDFLEDEIKAWWCRAVDRGCRVPSIDELNSKFNKRTSLGF